MTGAEQLSALGNTNLIVNFANDITDSSAITDVIGDDAEGIENEDGTTTYNIFNLPSIYSRLENGDIVHTESGTVMASRSDYDISPYGARVTFPPYNPDTEPGGGGAAEDPSASNDDTGASADSGEAKVLELLMKQAKKLLLVVKRLTELELERRQGLSTDGSI